MRTLSTIKILAQSSTKISRQIRPTIRSLRTSSKLLDSKVCDGEAEFKKFLEKYAVELGPKNVQSPKETLKSSGWMLFKSDDFDWDQEAEFQRVLHKNLDCSGSPKVILKINGFRFLSDDPDRGLEAEFQKNLQKIQTQRMPNYQDVLDTEEYRMNENKKKFLEESEDPCNSYKIDWDSEIEASRQTILKFESKYEKKF